MVDSKLTLAEVQSAYDSQEVFEKHLQMWNDAIHTRFVDELLAGSVKDEHLREYLEQDYLFFKAFLRLLGAAVAKAPSLTATLTLSQQLGFVANDENTYFDDCLAELGGQKGVEPNATTARFLQLYAKITTTGTYTQIIALLFVAEAIYLDWARRSSDANQTGGSLELAYKHQEWINIHLDYGFIDWVKFLKAEFTKLTLTPADFTMIEEVITLENDFFNAAYDVG